MRMLIALQTADAESCATPADWRPGDDVIIPAPGSCGTAKDRVEGAAGGDYYCLDWFLCFRKLPKSELTLPSGM
jgi:peroxiredoxin (alkyl hydroperoxide reductase subunit C)